MKTLSRWSTSNLKQTISQCCLFERSLKVLCKYSSLSIPKIGQDKIGYASHILDLVPLRM